MPGRRSALHGLLVVLFSCLVPGVLHTIALTSPDGEKSGNASDPTRVAHSGGVSNGLLALAFGAAAYAGAIRASPLSDTLVASGAWFNAIAYTLAALSGKRGLGPVCFTRESPFLLCLGEHFVSSPLAVAANALFVIAAAFVSYALIEAAWGTWALQKAPVGDRKAELETARKAAARKAPAKQAGKTAAGRGSHVALIRTCAFFAAITIPSVILHFMVDDGFHDKLAGLVFGKKEVEDAFPKYRSARYRTRVALHLWSGAAWMVVSLFQLSLRSLTSRLHKYTGRVGVAAAIVSIVGLTVFLEIGFSMSEKFAAVYFGSLWLFHLVRGFFQAQRYDFDGHARSMVRAVGISFGVGLIRFLFIPFVLLGQQPEDLRDSREFFGSIFWVAMTSAALGIEAYIACYFPAKKNAK